MKIIICGVGAVGSNLIRSLIPDLANKHHVTILDKDVVEERNVFPGTQWFSRDQIGNPKVDALEYNVYKWYGQEIVGKNKEVFPDDLYDYDLIVDCFDNYLARSITQSTFAEGICKNVVHIGFSDKMTFAIEWAEDYQVPSDITSGIDICEMPGASAFVASVGAVGSLIIQEFILNGAKKSIIGGKYIHSIAY